ncbi:MAG: DDE-type integrase/transposase/recombinase [Pyrinomonadaceae bacterium]
MENILRSAHRRLPFSISVDKNAAYPDAFNASQAERFVPLDCKLRRVKYLNNVIEQDHRFIKKKVRARRADGLAPARRRHQLLPCRA